MKVQIVSDALGRIVSIHQPGDIGHSPSGIGNAGVIAAQGQTVHSIELPQELRKVALLDLHHNYLVEVKGESVKLIQAKDFKGPLRAR